MLIVIGGSLLAVLGHRLWDINNMTDTNKTAAEAEHRARIERAARESTRALRASATTDPAALTALIGKYTEAPVITYEAAHKKFTAEVEMSTTYDTVHLLTVGVERIVSCELFTYTLGPDRAWRVDVATRGTATCLPGRQVADLARRAKSILENLNGPLTTVRQAERVLDQAGPPGRLTVRSMVTDTRTTTVSALLTDMTGAVDQCYNFSLSHHASGDRMSVTSMPTAAALCGIRRLAG
ncbi:hypothetical protein AB0N23_03355 [Streptomyces sp. NPDC052644]